MFKCFQKKKNKEDTQSVHFSQVLKNANIDLRREYERLYSMLYLWKISIMGQDTLFDLCKSTFSIIPFRGTCVSLDDFIEVHHLVFVEKPRKFDLNYLIRFCEFSYSIVLYNQSGSMLTTFARNPGGTYVQQVLKVIEKVGYMANHMPNGATDFVPKDQAAISVSEIVDPDLSYIVIEYNHHSRKGDLDRKKEVLRALADKLEPQMPKLIEINKSFATDLSFLFNNVDIRHNNTDPSGKNYKPYVAEMNAEQKEKWYDDTYQMCLLAFLELEHTERKNRIKELKMKCEQGNRQEA